MTIMEAGILVAGALVFGILMLMIIAAAHFSRDDDEE